MRIYFLWHQPILHNLNIFLTLFERFIRYDLTMVGNEDEIRSITENSFLNELNHQRAVDYIEGKGRYVILIFKT